MALPLAAIAAVASTAYSAIQRGRVQANASRAATALQSVPSRSSLVGTVLPGIERVLPGVGAVARTMPGVGTVVSAAGAVGSGFSLARSFGGQTFDITGAPVRRRYRRMNVCNVKALRRAGRRVEGFVKLAKSLVTMPGARARFPIKKRGKKRC